MFFAWIGGDLERGFTNKFMPTQQLLAVLLVGAVSFA